MSQLAITRGRHYTPGGRQIYDDYGADLGSDYDGDFIGADTPICDHCDRVSSWTWGFPVILQEARRWFATMFFNQCDVCHSRARAIMDTSDHLALGKDEWDLIDSATDLIIDDRWDTFPKWTMAKAEELAMTKMEQIEDMREKIEERYRDDEDTICKTVPFFSLVNDVLGVIQTKLVEAEFSAKREEAARTIQRGWRKLRQRILMNVETPYPCGICGAVLDVSDGIPLLTIDDREGNTTHPICYQECEIICRRCGWRQCETVSPDDVSESPGTCDTCGAAFTCFAYQ